MDETKEGIVKFHVWDPETDDFEEIKDQSRHQGGEYPLKLL